MGKKAKLLAAGALTALAFTALPSMASAGEFVSTCSSGGTCSATISGGAATNEEDSGGVSGTATCTASSGTANVTNNSSTGTVQLLFTGCTTAGFFNCTTPGRAGGEITTNTLTSHSIFLEDGATLPVGVLLTGVNVTFTCAGGISTWTVTGNVIGNIESPECQVSKSSHKVNFVPGTTTGTQEWRQITTTGTVFDLTSGTHASDSTTTQLQWTGTITYNGGKTVKLDC